MRQGGQLMELSFIKTRHCYGHSMKQRGLCTEHISLMIRMISVKKIKYNKDLTTCIVQEGETSFDKE